MATAILDARPDADGYRIRGIFKKKRAAERYYDQCLLGRVLVVSEPMPYADGVKELRKRVFQRDDYRCVKCARTVTLRTGQLHEKIHRGQGGERTLENTETLCAECHVGRKGEHGFARGRRRIEA